MTVKESYTLLMSKFPELKPVKCYEYASVFVFQTVPKNYSSDRSVDNLLNGLMSINKQTGLIRDFKPFHIPVEEYRAGKEVTIDE